MYGSCWLKEELLVMKVHPSNGQSTVVAIAHIAGQVQGCRGNLGLVMALWGHGVVMKVTSGCVHTYKCIEIVQRLAVRPCKHTYRHALLLYQGCSKVNLDHANIHTGMHYQIKGSSV